MKASDKILLAIYKWRPYIKDNASLEFCHLAWILKYGPDGWITDEGLQKLEYSKKPDDPKSEINEIFKDRSKIIKSLAILSAKRCLDFEPPEGISTTFRLNLLPNGIIRADKITTKTGRVDLWFSEKKDGIVGITLTALISATVSVLMNLFF